MKNLIEHYRNNPMGIVALIFGMGLLTLAVIFEPHPVAVAIFSASILLNVIMSYVKANKK